jgi:hypothetical protein
MMEMSFLKSKALKFLLCAIVVSTVSETLFATPAETLTISSPGFTSVTCSAISVNPNCSFDGASGYVAYTGPFGDWTINVSSGLSLTAGSPLLLLSTTDWDNSVLAPAPLTITFTDYDFTFTPLGVTLNASEAVDPSALAPGTSANSATYTDIGGTSAPFGQLTLNGTGNSTVGPIPIIPVAPYSVSLTSVISGSAGTLMDTGYSLYSSAPGGGGGIIGGTPEPGLYILTGVGLAGLLAMAAARRRTADTNDKTI